MLGNGKGLYFYKLLSIKQQISLGREPSEACFVKRINLFKQFTLARLNSWLFEPLGVY
ncbi:hypothetical protein Plhal304r1_c033g0105031 [Plasmopara halstedii]